jgi:glyoxylase-like metal-dependent hydrolase (beta-lactamase superfamily II)
MLDPNAIIRGNVNEIAPGVWYVPALMANLYFVGDRQGPWVMVDAGTPGTAWRIRMAVDEIHGGRKPEAIVLTHGHFDHVGALRELAEAWDVPIFAHPLEFPYLDGRADYPPPDPTVGGFMAQLSRVFPKKGINVGSRLRPVLMDNTIPHMRGWRAVYTPGHSPGHISLFRDEDRVLIAGDAVITIDQQNAAKLFSQVRELHGPPQYFTPDWEQAHRSIRTLADLRPLTVATGHGLPVSGEDVPRLLVQLAETFRPPEKGRYVGSPAMVDEQGPYFVPPAPPDRVPMYAAGAALAAVGLLFLNARRGKGSRAEASGLSGSMMPAPTAGTLRRGEAVPRSRMAYDIYGRRT